MFREGLALCAALDDRRAEADFLNNLMATHQARGHVTEALRISEQALARWTALGIPAGEGATLLNRGVLLWQAGRFDEARAAYARALAIFRARQDRRSEAYTLTNAAVVLETLGDRRLCLE